MASFWHPTNIMRTDEHLDEIVWVGLHPRMVDCNWLGSYTVEVVDKSVAIHASIVMSACTDSTYRLQTEVGHPRKQI